MLTLIQKKVLRQVVQTLKEYGIKFQITGGLAAIIYGGKRPLFDIDLDVLKKDIKKVREIFKKYIIKDFYRHQSEYFDIWIMTLEINGVLVDISQGEDCSMKDKVGNWIKMDTDLSHPTLVNFEGMELTVESKEELTNYKKVLGRDTDLVDIQEVINKE